MGKVVKFAAVPQDKLAAFWPKVSGLIAEALKAAPVDKRQTLRKIKARIADGRYVLVLVAQADEVKSLVVLDRQIVDGKRIMFIVAAWGLMNESLEGLGRSVWQMVEAVAREQGCSDIQLVGRPGWVKWFKANTEGARVQQVLITIGVR